MAPDDRVIDPEALEQPERLGEVARRDLHLVRPARAATSTIGRSTRTCGLFVRSTQMRIAGAGYGAGGTPPGGVRR